MDIFSLICGLVLFVYLAYESAVSLVKYRRLKLAIADGDNQARLRFYWEIVLFEWVSAVLAFAALGFASARLGPSRLQIGQTAFGRWCATVWRHVDTGFLAGAGVGLLFSIGVIIAILWCNRRRTAGKLQPVGASSWQSILTDFSALIPTTRHERGLFLLVALSAGICEEVVYRAWLLDVLHGVVGLGGFTLVAVAAVAFGLGHYYQGLSGILITTLLGLIFCGLYVASGSLLVPIVVHAILDLRIALIPSVPSAGGGKTP